MKRYNQGIVWKMVVSLKQIMTKPIVQDPNQEFFMALLRYANQL